VGDDATGSLVPLTPPAGTAAVFINGAPITVPWPYTDKFGNTQPQAGGLLEVGVDLTALGLNEDCFASLLAETRTSDQITASLGDFALGSFSSCTTPTITTTAIPSSVTLGTTPVTLRDTADLEGGNNPTGTITFTLTLNNQTVHTEVVQVTHGNGTYSTPNGFTLTSPGTVTGTYHWLASYSGDEMNDPVDSGALAEPVVVSPATPDLSTTILQPTGPVTAGAVTVQDQATLSGGALFTGAGALTFVLQDSSNQPVAGTAFTTAVTAAGDFDTPAVPVTLGAGTYHWEVSFSGDANNAAPPAVTNESFVVSQATPDLSTSILQPTGPVTAGAVTVRDRATLTGGSLFTGDGALDFVLVNSSNAAISGTFFTTAVSGNGDYDTPAVSVNLSADTYHWVVSFSGDANNAAPPPVTDEAFTVTPASPAISTTPIPNIALLGATLQDEAVLAGGFDPTGTITFSLYAPGVDPTVGPAAHTDTVTISGAGTYHTSVGFASTAAGIWHWVADYSGDSNNRPASSSPLVEPVTVEEEADVAVAKTVDNPTPVFGTPVTYTITVTNHGPDAATNVMVADPLPAGLTLIAAAPSQGAFDAASGVWFVGTLGNGVTAILHLTAQTTADGPIVNNAVARADQFDPDLSNNEATETIIVQPSSPQIGKGLFLASNILGIPTPDPARFPQNAQFVIQLYGDLLHRQADALGLASWCDALDNGASRLQVVQAIQSSPEYRGDEVEEVYSRLLHRAADPSGHNAFVQFLENGGTVEQVEALIAGSPEYHQRRGGGSNEGFLTALCQDGLGRAVDAGGRMAWDEALASGVSRTQVAADLFSSPEYDTDLVKQDYAAYLRRPADAGGLGFWLTQLQGGVGNDQVLAGILASDEYFTQVA
jgi:uncharacterized repeat protein (TIGR01451 family)